MKLHKGAALAALNLGIIASSQMAAQEAAELDTVVVTAENPGYAAPESVTMPLKSDIPLLETPQAISVINRNVIVDQSAEKLEDVVKNAAGVSIGGYYANWDYFRIRGFDASGAATYVDGLLSGDWNPGEEVWNIERAEVIKGPASTLFGQGPLGGFVNIVSKRPFREFGGEVQVSGGMWDFYQGAIDVNVPLLTTGSPAAATPASAKGAKSVMPVAEQAGIGIYARLNALYENTGSFVDYAGGERIFVAPSLLFEFDEDTSLTILAAYKEDHLNFAFPLPARGTVLGNPNGPIPVNRYIGNPALENDEWQRNIRLGYEFKHSFNDHVTFRQNFRYYWHDWQSKNLSYPSDFDGRLLGLSGYSAEGGNDGLRVDTGLDFKFETGVVEHTLTTGVDYRRTKDGYTARDSLDLVYMDVYHPNYAAMPDYVYGPSYSGSTVDDDLGFYLQEHAKIGNFALTLGGRFDISGYEDGTAEYEENAFSPKAGLTYEFVPGVAAYANYSRSFNPQWSDVGPDGKPVEPEEGENWEAGVKYSLLKGKLTGLIAAYQLTRENVATSNLSTPDPYDAIVTGEQRVRGIEFETAAELLPGLQLTAAYAYMDGEITKDNTFDAGSRLQGVPDHSVNAWLKYTVQEGALKGFGVGLGGRYYSSQAADVGDSFSIPSHGLLDAALYYERDQWRVQVNFNNVTDKRYFAGAYDELYVLPGEPFNVTASVSWKF